MHDLPPPPHPHQRPSRPAQPHLEWALATGFSYLRKGEWIPLLIEFDTKEVRRAPGNERLTALEAFATRLWLADDPRTLDGEFVIPGSFCQSARADASVAGIQFLRWTHQARRRRRTQTYSVRPLEPHHCSRRFGTADRFAKKPTPATSTRVPMSAPKPPSPTLHAAASHRRGIFGRMGDAVRKLTGSASAGAQPPPPKVFAAGAPTTPGHCHRPYHLLKCHRPCRRRPSQFPVQTRARAPQRRLAAFLSPSSIKASPLLTRVSSWAANPALSICGNRIC